MDHKDYTEVSQRWLRAADAIEACVNDMHEWNFDWEDEDEFTLDDSMLFSEELFAALKEIVPVLDSVGGHAARVASRLRTVAQRVEGA